MVSPSSAELPVAWSTFSPDLEQMIGGESLRVLPQPALRRSQPARTDQRSFDTSSIRRHGQGTTAPRTDVLLHELRTNASKLFAVLTISPAAVTSINNRLRAVNYPGVSRSKRVCRQASTRPTSSPASITASTKVISSSALQHLSHQRGQFAYGGRT